MAAASNNIPTILVVFGATGDLMRKKIIPALFRLYKKKELPHRFHVVGFSRRDFTDQLFHNFIEETHAAQEKKFTDLFSYHQGQFAARADYHTLASVLTAQDTQWGMCANKLFYLAASPEFYPSIFKNLSSSGLTHPCDPQGGWTRVIVEKPFGKDLETAIALEALLSRLFEETQIYRIDHYLAKEMLQNILAFRFSNSLFEQNWNKESIEKIEVRLWETLGVEHRGDFYDGLGALRDVGQNHLLQMLALATMGHPGSFSAEAIRKKREEILQTLVAPQREEITSMSFRAQYDGYREIAGVAPASQTETFFKIRVFLADPRWQGVPIILESGKRLSERRKEIAVTFRHPTPCLCPEGHGHLQNKIVIRLEPQEQIMVQFWSKKPGLSFEGEERDLSFLLRKSQQHAQYSEEYEKLLLDCIAGSQTLFISSVEVKAMWRSIDPYVRAWQANAVPLARYTPDTNEPVVASAFIQEGRFPTADLHKEIGVVGLGKMGGNIARRLHEKQWHVIAYDAAPKTARAFAQEGIVCAASFHELAHALPRPRMVWLMTPPGAVDGVLFGKDGLTRFLQKGDIVIDGGNSFYKDSARRFNKLKKQGICFADAGVSGGPGGARHGGALMIGGKKEMFKKLEPLFYDLAQKDGYQFFEGPGAGHFVKMIHNGIEYGIMQAIAEGFTILKKSRYALDLGNVADVYNHGSVIESRLIGWLADAFRLSGEDLKDISGAAGHTGEGAWTVKTAEELKIRARVIEEALRFRMRSEKRPSYTGKILSALRHQFGGHRQAA